MKLKIAASLIIFSFLLASCNKKQCPAYGSVDQKVEAAESKTA